MSQASQMLMEEVKGLSNGSAGAPDGLRELMEAFTQTTRQLEETHVALQREVARLQGELASANARLKRTQELAALGEMAAGIAHEIRNPLGSIQLYVQALGEDLADAPAQAELCGKISRGVRRMDAIVQDVLLFAREMKIERTPMTAASLLMTAANEAEGLVATAGVELDIRLDDAEELMIQADHRLLVQAVGNLMRNAVEAMQEAGSDPIRLNLDASRRRVRRPDGKNVDRAVIVVGDTGPGIDEDVLQRMFNPFFTTRRTGTGLGLAIVHRIVDAHGGEINVESASGRGTRFELWLPIAGPAGQMGEDDHEVVIVTNGRAAKGRAARTVAAETS